MVSICITMIGKLAQLNYSLFNHALVFLEVGIRFQNALYEPNEGSSPLQVCVVLTGEIGSSISVTLISTDITATRKISIASYGTSD